MANGEWTNSEWRMANDGWSAKGGWRMENGGWSFADLPICRFADLPICYLLFAIWMRR